MARAEVDRGFSYHAEQTLRAHKQPMQVETCFVFVRATAESNDRTIGQDNFEPEDVIAGDAIFQTARATCVSDNVAADETLPSTGRIRWVKEAFFLDCVLKSCRDDAGLCDGTQPPT